MPYYIFSNPNKPSEVIEVFFSMKDKKEYIKNGIKWNREYIIPQASFNTKIDPLSSKDFVNKTRDKTGSIGNILDESKELSLKRTEIIGNDPIKNKWYSNWQKRRKKIHPDVQKQKGKEDLAKKGVILED